MPLPVVVNASGGGAAALGDRLIPAIAEAFAAAGRPVAVAAVEGRDVADAVARLAADHPRIVVAGGDGTVSCAAGCLVGSGTELALLPLGTLNHLARDLGIPGDLAAAAALAARGRARAIDLGEVNGRLFVNNVSIGLYPLMVRGRTAAQEERHLPKWLATLPAAWDALARLPHHRLRVRFGDADRRISTPLLFVGNNDYSLEAGTVGRRSALDDGRLSVFAVARRSRLGLLWFALRALAGRARSTTDFTALGNCSDIHIDAHSGSIDIAIDGEVTELASPLSFRVKPGALKVVAPLTDIAGSA